MSFGFGGKDDSLLFLILILILFSCGSFGGSFGKGDDDFLFVLILIVILCSCTGGFCSLGSKKE